MAKRIHKNYREGRCAFYTNSSKFTERVNTRLAAQEAIQEGNLLREKLKGKRILGEITKKAY